MKCLVGVSSLFSCLPMNCFLSVSVEILFSFRVHLINRVVYTLTLSHEKHKSSKTSVINKTGEHFL